jgi:type II secretory pathway predicted ATPase ExeA
MTSSETVKNLFGLSMMPFGKNISVRQLFLSSSFQEAIARLEMALDNEEAALLTGAVGCGKSNVLRCFTTSLDPNAYAVIYIPADSFKIGEIAKRALASLKVEIPYSASLALRRLQQTIVKLNSEKGIKPLLIVDEVQDLPIPTLVSLKNLLNYGMDSQIMLFLLLCGQTSVHQSLAYPCLEALNRRLRIRYSMRALSLEETSAYISHHMKLAGVQQPVFTDDAKAAIFQHTKGIPSSINAVCFRSLIYAAAHSQTIIEPSVLEIVMQAEH